VGFKAIQKQIAKNTETKDAQYEFWASPLAHCADLPHEPSKSKCRGERLLRGGPLQKSRRTRSFIVHIAVDLSEVEFGVVVSSDFGLAPYDMHI